MAPERSLPPPEADERTTLTAFLDAQRAVPPSALSLLGLVRHMAEAFAVWEAECANSRALVAAAPSLDTSGLRGGWRFTLRWVLTHLVEEYARHNGHADLLRERIDGRTGE